MKRQNYILNSAADFVVLAAAAALAVSIARANKDNQWNPAWGVHEEDWYDPSTLFNQGNQTDQGTATYGYDDTYYNHDLWTGNAYFSHYAYDLDTFHFYPGYAYYQWTPETQQWGEVEGTEEASKQAGDEAKITAHNKEDKQHSKKSIDESDVVTMRGPITHVDKIEIQRGETHHLAVVDVADGKNVLVDFGPKADIGTLRVRKGEKVQVRGPRAKLRDRYVLIAQQVSKVGSLNVGKERALPSQH